MFAHPNRATLEAFLRSRLPAAETKAVLTHLVGGCPSCQAVMKPFTTAMFEPAPQEPPALTPEVSAAYDAAIASAFAKVAVALRSEMAKSEDVEGKVARLLQERPGLPAARAAVFLDLAAVRDAAREEPRPAPR